MKYLLLIILYFTLLLVGYISIIIYFNYKIKKILREKYPVYKDKLNKKHFSLINFDIIKNLKKKKDLYKKQCKIGHEDYSYARKRIEQLEKEKNDLKYELVEYKNQYLNIQSFDDSAKTPKIQSMELDYKSQTNLNVLYYMIPEEDGSFLDNNSTSTPTNRSYFKIEYLENENTGNLIYRSGELDSSALNQMDLILGPVCEIENTSIQNASHINVRSNGTVFKEDGKWVTNKKIKITID